MAAAMMLPDRRIELEALAVARRRSDEVDVGFNETELFPAVRTNDVKKIFSYARGKEANINAVDTCSRNALQAALGRDGLVKVEACRALIQLGIHLEHKEDINNTTAISHLVYFYKHHNLGDPSETERRKLELFRCMVEGGADLGGEYNNGVEKPVSIREKIKTHPEMEVIVQDVNSKRANEIFWVIRGEFKVTKLICEMMGSDPGPGWRPALPLEKPWNSKCRKIGYVVGATFAVITAIFLKKKCEDFVGLT